jgi:Glycosyltransferase Family 4
MMKASLEANPVSMVDLQTMHQSTRVGMHILGTARKDVRVMRAATALAEAGFKVFMIDIESESARPHEEEIQGIHFKHVIMPGWFTYTKTRRLDPWFLIKVVVVYLRIIYLLIRTPVDVYHAHDETALPSCYLAARWHRKPLIFDAHEVPSSSLPAAQKMSLISLSKRFFLKIVPHCKAVITVSPSIVDEFQQHYGSQEVSLIRNVPEYQVVSKTGRLRQQLNLGPDVRLANLNLKP